MTRCRWPAAMASCSAITAMAVRSRWYWVSATAKPGGKGPPGRDLSRPSTARSIIGQGERHGQQPAAGDEEGAAGAPFAATRGRGRTAAGWRWPAPGVARVSRRAAVFLPEAPGDWRSSAHQPGRLAARVPARPISSAFDEAGRGEAQHIDEGWGRRGRPAPG